MKEILARLKELLLNTTDNKFKLVRIVSDFQALLMNRVDKFPCITIMATGEDHVPTDASLLNKRVYKVKIRLWYQEIKLNQVTQTNTGFENVFEATDFICTNLWKDKRLNSLVSGMEEIISINDWEYVNEEGNRTIYIGRDIEVAYYKFVEYSGVENAQPDTALPEPNTTCKYVSF